LPKDVDYAPPYLSLPNHMKEVHMNESCKAIYTHKQKVDEQVQEDRYLKMTQIDKGLVLVQQ